MMHWALHIPKDIGLACLTSQKPILSWDAQHVLLRFPKP